MKNIVLVGGGYGGILTAKKLEKKLRKDGDVSITLIDRKSYHTMLTELHEVAANRVDEESIRIDFKKVFANRKVNVVLDEVTAVDYEKKVVRSDDKEYPFDYLVIGTGSRQYHWKVEGACEHAYSLWSYEDAVELKEKILDNFRKAQSEKDPAKRQELLTFVTVGSGFTGVEMVGELAEWAPQLCEEFSIPREEVRIINADFAKSVLPNFPEKLIKKTERRLQKLGVEMMMGQAVSKVTDHDITIGDNKVINTSTVIWCAGIEGSELAETIDAEKERGNRLVTNKHLQLQGHDNVFVVGDNIYYIPEGETMPVPQMVENAEHSSATVAKNILAQMKGQDMSEYKPAFHGAMVCVGGRYGVAHLGMPGKFFSLSGFFAMFVKHFINIVYFLQVAGFNKTWSYLMHEVFHVKNNRSFVGGHFANRSPNFWKVPLRLFVGYKWLEQGLHKLPDIFNDFNNIFLFPAPPSPDGTAGATTEAVTDAVAAASEQVAEYVDVAALYVPGFVEKIVSWGMDLMFYTDAGTYTGFASIMQAGIVFGEVLIGLALIGGLFTAPAAIASILLGAMIWSSGMAPVEMLWYIFAGIALIGGSGSAFGLDYYVYPVLKKWWKNRKWVRKNYFYVD